MTPHIPILNDEYFMQQALLEAKRAKEENEIPIGCVIVHQDRIIARAYNRTEVLHDVTAHAEMQAITAAANLLGGKYLKGCTLYSTVEPCPMCAGAIAWAQIPTIVFGTHDYKRGYMLFSPSLLHPKTTVRYGVLEEQCATIIKSFFAEKRGDIKK